MGLVYKPVGLSSFPYRFAQYFVENYNFNIMVETGTYMGETAAKCRKLFDRVYTIEASRECYDVARSKYGDMKDLFMLLGDSRERLKEVCEREKDSNVVFWLDAHYSGGSTFKNHSPLLDEIAIINNLLQDRAVIIIDDARFIHMNYIHERYCEYKDIIPLLTHTCDRYIVCINDAFIAAPRRHQGFVDEYCVEYAQKELRALSKLPDIVSYAVRIGKKMPKPVYNAMKKIYHWF